MKHKGNTPAIYAFQSSSPVAGGCDEAMIEASVMDHPFQSSSPVAGGCDPRSPEERVWDDLFQSSSPVAGGCDSCCPDPTPKLQCRMFQSSSPVAGGCDANIVDVAFGGTTVSILIPRCRGMRRERPPARSTASAHRCFNPHPPLPGDATCTRAGHRRRRRRFQSSSPVAGGCDLSSTGFALAVEGFQSSSPVAGGCDGLERSVLPHQPAVVSILIPRCRGMRRCRRRRESVVSRVSILIPRCRGMRRSVQSSPRSPSGRFNPHPPLPGDATAWQSATPGFRSVSRPGQAAPIALRFSMCVWSQ